MSGMPRLRAGDLAAIAIPPGPEWPSLIQGIWDAGAAVLPVDDRLPPAERERLLQAARPAAIYAGSWWPLDSAEPVPSNAALVVPTSGTEGRPKLAVLDHDAVLAAVEASADRLDAQPDDPWLSCLPLGHVGGLLVVARSLVLGNPLTIHKNFDPDRVAQAGARFTSLVPTMLIRLLDGGADLSRFKALLIGGAASPQDVLDRAKNAVTTYGLTESCGGVVYDGVPLGGVTMRLGDDDQILLKGPTLMLGYLRADQQPFDAQGWLRTGDAGVLDDAGRLRSVERMDDVIVSGGEKIHPGRVEEVLLRHPAIRDVAVIGRADPEWGRRAVALIVPAAAGDPIPSLQEIRDLVAQTLPRSMAPKEVRAVESLPRTPGGKLRRRLLR